MATELSELNSMEQLQALVVSGNTQWRQFGAVATRRFGDLILFNYTVEAVMNNQWTWLEQVSRGLILNAVTGEIIARPFDKFWNWLEGGRLPTPGSKIVSVNQKEDGSLGISYVHEGQLRIATRGSFESEQAKWATAFINRTYPNLIDEIPAFWTLMFEIVYPDNRIVVNYNGREDLILLAIRNRETGRYSDYKFVQHVAETLGIPTAPTYSFEDMDNVLAMTSDIEHEGYVVEFSDGSRFKIKGDKYRMLHKLISQVSFNSVLDAASVGGYQDYRIHIPEEYWPEIDSYFQEIETYIHTAHETLLRTMPTRVEHPEFFEGGREARRLFAQWVLQQPHHLQHYYFKLIDNRFDVADLYKLIERRNTITRVDRGEA